MCYMSLSIFYKKVIRILEIIFKKFQICVIFADGLNVETNVFH